MFFIYEDEATHKTHTDNHHIIPNANFKGKKEERVFKMFWMPTYLVAFCVWASR